MKCFTFICTTNPTSCADNNYRMLLNAKHGLTIQRLSVWNERSCKLNDNINVIEEMIDVKDEFNEYQAFVSRSWKNSLKLCVLINCSYVLLNKKVNFCVYIFYHCQILWCILKCVNKDIIIIGQKPQSSLSLDGSVTEILGWLTSTWPICLAKVAYHNNKISKASQVSVGLTRMVQM